MTPERLQQWIYKPVPGGKTLQLQHEQALGQGLTVASWSREEVDDLKERNQSAADILLDAAQDHADSVGESCRFIIQWLNETGVRPLRSLVHKALPSDVEASGINEHALRADTVSANAMVGQLLNHISQQQRVMNGSIGAVLAAYERALMMQNATMIAQQKIISDSRAELADIIAPEPPSASSEELSQMKVRALQKLIDVGPDVVQLGMKAVATHLHGKQVESMQAIRRAAANDNAHAARQQQQHASGHDDDDDDDDALESATAGGDA